VLIGTNLASLERMLSRALSDWLSQQEPEADDPEGSVDAILRHLRFTTNADTLTERLRRTLTEGGASTATLERALHPTEGLAFSDACFEQLRESWEAAPGVDSVARDDALQSCRVLVDEYRDICALKRQMLQREAAGALSAEEQQRLLVAFKKRVSVVRDSNATGDQVVHHVAGVIPFGHHARILGCQNIKGTGLDFVYRWVSLEQVVLALEQLTRQPSTRTETLNWLNTHGDYGVLDAELALRTVKSLRVDEGKDWARHQTRLARLETHLQSLLDVLRKRLEGTRRRGILAPILGAVEPWVDHLDSIRRQRRSRLIMEDLFAQRIGQGRAAQLLRELVARGKGGWLASDVARAMTRTHQDE
jgi:hypothetical protein